MNTTLEVAGQTYRVDKMAALTQLHIGRRLLPALIAVGIRAEELANMKEGEGGGFAHLMEPAVKIMGVMTDEDVNYVLFKSLQCIRRKQDERYAPVVAGERLIFEDIEMPIMVRLVAAVIQENMGGFFALLPGVSPSPASSGTTQDQAST